MSVEIAGDRPELLATLTSDDVVVERIEHTGPLFDGAYELLERTFAPDVLEPKEVLADRLSAKAAESRDYLSCYTIAYLTQREKRLIASFLVGDIMWLEQPGDGAFLAIGNIVTAPRLKEMGLVGAGTKVVEAAIQAARQEVAADGHRLLCVVAEAEDRSLGFWKKRGFLYPAGCNYYQPPLEWNEWGDPVHTEVRETLLLAPVEMDAQKVDPQTLKSIILAVYENWSLRLWRDELSPEAMQKAERYVMDHVYAKVLSTMPAEQIVLTSDF